MDFVKSLLVYMGLTFAVTLQGTSAPTETPTPPPQAIVTPAPGETADPNATAAAGATVTVPQITPNKSYRILKPGSRGELVRKLQARLKELGYLTGLVDGAYGQNTRRAVVRFQAANGLTQDGVAGDHTLTILYESPNVVANPDVTAVPSESPAALPSPSADPAAEAASTASVSPTDTPAPAGDEIPLLEGAKIVVNDAGEPLSVLRKIDGVNQKTSPRVYRDGEGVIYLSLYDLGQNAPGFALQVAEQTYTLTFDQTVVNLYWDDADGWSADVGETILPLSVGDVLSQGDDILISTAFLQKSLNAVITWDEDEMTLIIRIRPAGADDLTS